MDCRYVFATNKNLLAESEAGNFREDLYYRINVIPIEIPPLRERRTDIPMLAKFFADQFARKYNKPEMFFEEGAMALLRDAHWPGNIRELENFIERAVILTPGTVLRVPIAELQSGRTAVSVPGTREHVERDALLRILKETRGRVGGADGAAARMGLKRTTLISRMKKLGIDARAVS